MPALDDYRRIMSSEASAQHAYRYSCGYQQGRSDALAGNGRADLSGATQSYADGYIRGYEWIMSHPPAVLPAS